MPNDQTVVYEEDIEAALKKCVEVLGPIGKYEYPAENVGICLVTKEHGSLWYGDLTKEDVEYRLQALARALNVDTIYMREYL